MSVEILQQGIPLTQASKALIILHGRGGAAQEMLSLAQKCCDDQFYIAAPQAPGHTWYPNSFMSEEKLNEPTLSQSIRAIKELIEETAKHVPTHHIYLMGFSQGACLSLEISARFATKYGGVIALTGEFMGPTIDEKKYQGNLQGTKVFISNGDQDPFIPLTRSKESKKLMEKIGAHVTLQIYPGRPHIVSEDEIKWVRNNILLT